MKAWALVLNVKRGENEPGDIAWCFGNMNLADILRYKINDELDNGEFALVQIDDATPDDVKKMNDHEIRFEEAATLKDVEPAVIQKTMASFKTVSATVKPKVI